MLNAKFQIWIIVLIRIDPSVKIFRNLIQIEEKITRKCPFIMHHIRKVCKHIEWELFPFPSPFLLYFSDFICLFHSSAVRGNINAYIYLKQVNCLLDVWNKGVWWQSLLGQTSSMVIKGTKEICWTKNAHAHWKSKIRRRSFPRQ